MKEALEKIIQKVLIKKYSKIIGFKIEVRPSIGDNLMYIITLYYDQNNRIYFYEKQRVRKEIDSLFAMMGPTEYDYVKVEFTAVNEEMSI